MRAIVLTFCILLVSCKLQHTKAQENILNKNDIDNLTEINNSSNPNTVILTAKIVLVHSDPVNICGKKNKNVITLKVIRVISSSHGIINPIAINSEYNMILSTIIKSPKSFKVGDLVKIEALEKICFNASESKYMILNIE